MPAVDITSYEPAQYNLGRATSLTVVQLEGRRSATEFVIAESSTTKDDSGVETTVTKHVGEVVLSATVFNAAGRAILAEKEYVGGVESPHGEDEATQLAAAAAIRQLLFEITPRRVSRSVTLDDSDEGQKTILEMARRGNLGQAIADCRAYASARSECVGRLAAAQALEE